MKQSLTKQGPWLALFGGLAVSAQSNAAGTIQIDDTRSVSIGAGLRTQYETVEDSAPNGSDDSSDFVLQSTQDRKTQCFPMGPRLPGCRLGTA
jgi:hypothetical protein